MGFTDVQLCKWDVKTTLHLFSYSPITIGLWKSIQAWLKRSVQLPSLQPEQMLDKTPLEKRMCPLCFSNDIGDEKHYIFYCTNPKLVEIRKTFTPEIYETFTPYPDVNSINDILHIILKGSPYVN